MALLETLTNRESQRRLGRLAAELDRLAAGDASARATVPALRSRHYPASVAVVEVLSEAGIAMRPCEIHEAVDARLGRPVPRAIVKSFLLYSSKREAARLERLLQADIGCQQPSALPRRSVHVVRRETKRGGRDALPWQGCDLRDSVGPGFG